MVRADVLLDDLSNQAALMIAKDCDPKASRTLSTYSADPSLTLKC